MIAWLLAFTLLQQPAARISGVVVTDDATRAPVRHALVTLSGAASDTMITDVDGAFVFADLRPGHYHVVASKPGFAEAEFGARLGRDIGTPIAVAAGQQVTSLQVRLPRGAVITGTVIGRNGEPAPAMTVTALRLDRSLIGSARALTTIGRAMSNIDGVFRLYGLPDGDFVVMARPDAPTDDAAGYAPTFYPSVAAAADAPLVSVKRGEEQSGIDITLRASSRAGDAPAATPAPTVSRVAEGETGGVHGNITDAAGAPSLDYIVVVFSADRAQWKAPERVTRVTPPDTNGAWAVEGLPAGDYRVAAITDWMSYSRVTAELLNQLMTASAAITIIAGETATISLRVGG